MDSDLTVKDICRIIRASAPFVSELEYKGLKIIFKTVVTGKDEASVNIAPLTEQTHEAQTREAILQEEARLKEDRLDNMFIEDPLQAEQLLQDNNMEFEFADREDDGEE